jgi:hypothetical protein
MTHDKKIECVAHFLTILQDEVHLPLGFPVNLSQTIVTRSTVPHASKCPKSSSGVAE